MDGRARVKVVSPLCDIVSPTGTMMLGALAYDTRTNSPGKVDYIIVAWHYETAATRRIRLAEGDCYMLVTFNEVVQGIDTEGQPCPVLICDEL